MLKQAIERARHSNAENDDLTALIADDDSSDSDQQETGVERVAIVQPDALAALPGTVPYRICRLGFTRYNGNEFHYPQYRKEQSEMLAKVVSEEGPIHIELATRRILAAWRLTRAGVRIVEAMTEAIRMCERRSLLKKHGNFLWPIDLSNVPVRVPAGDMQETYREVAHIPSEEIQSCMLLIIRHAVGIGVESLIKETANVFGFNRTGDRIRDRLLKECKALQRQHAAVNIDGSLSLNVNNV